MGFASPYRMPGWRPLAGAPPPIVVEPDETEPPRNGCARAVECPLADIYVVDDAKKNGIKPLPYVLATVALGSIGLLAYFVRRNLVSEASRSPHAPEASR